MRIEPLNQANGAEWAQYLPEEIFVELMRGSRGVHAIGVRSMEQPCGAACWEEQDTAWFLRSIYVSPACRHQGMGRKMVSAIARQMQEDGRDLNVSYELEPGRDHDALLGFFRACGFRMELMELPLGVTDLETVQTALEERNAYKKTAAARALDELTTRERHIVNEWLIDMTGDRLGRYMGPHANGYVVMSGGELYGAILYSMYRDGARLDYCWVDREHKQVFLPLLACAAEDVGSRCAGNPKHQAGITADSNTGITANEKANIKIEMILSNGRRDP